MLAPLAASALLAVPASPDLQVLPLPSSELAAKPHRAPPRCPRSVPKELRVLSGRGKIKDSGLNLTEVLWVGPECLGVFTGSPSVVRDPRSGELLFCHE